MGEKLIDDLARALGTPMPRRRVLRVLGASLVALSVPGTRPRIGSAGTRRTSKCGPDQRVCREFSAEEWCCPRPSWQFWCGTRRGQCFNRCTGEAKFPCTGLIPDKFSGVNGICCDRRLHRACKPDDPKQRMSGGGSIPQCLPCLGTPCGPNKKYESGHPLRWACCEKPNTCRKDGSCRCPDGKPSCGGKNCCKRGKVCKQCVDPTSSEVRLTGTVRCCGKDEFCCADRCCKQGTECCNSRCCPPNTQCAWMAGGPSRDSCCPQARVLSIGDRNSCCPVNTVPGEAGCCGPDKPDCCAGVGCESGSYCVRGKCVR